MKKVDNSPGTYALIMISTRDGSIQIGKLGQLQVQRGFYVYVGSAFGPGGIKSRVSHHQKTAIRPHWHIDYLRSITRLQEVWYSYDPLLREHQWANLIKNLPNASIPLGKFGASDCNCESHLFFFPRPPPKSAFQRKIHTQLPGHSLLY